MRKLAVFGSIGLLLAWMICVREPAINTGNTRAVTAESLQVEIESLRVPKVAWRGIPWKSCLLEGLKEAREKGKPVVLWVFLDRPIDDARC